MKTTTQTTPAFIIDTDTGKAVSFFERFESAMTERNRLEPTRTRADGRWRFMVENYFPRGGNRPQDADLTKQRLADIGGLLFAYTYS